LHLKLTDGGEDRQRIEERLREVPLVLGHAAFSYGLAGRAPRIRPGVLARHHVLDDSLHQLILKLRDLLVGQLRPVLTVEDVQILRDGPDLLHGPRPGLVIQLHHERELLIRQRFGYCRWKDSPRVYDRHARHALIKLTSCARAH